VRQYSWSLWALLALGCPNEGPKVAQSAEPHTQAAEQPHVDEPEHEALPTRVRLSSEVVAAAKIRTEAVSREVLATTIALPGEIVADPDRSARVASPIVGRLERVYFREGSTVKKGEVLASIRVPDLGKLRSAHAASLAKAKAARSNADRLKGLVDQRLASNQGYLDALATAEALEFEAGAGAEQIAALGLGTGGSEPSELTLRAPISGVVVARNAVVGQPLSAEEVIAEIVDLAEVWFLGRVFEKDLGKLKLDASADVKLNAYPEEHFAGKVEYIGRQVDFSARTVTARVRLTNRSDLLRIGLFGTGYVATGQAEGAKPVLVVPRSALTEVAGKPVVFVRQADQDFELHQLLLGESASGKVHVITGLREGEQVVVEGVFTLKSAVLKSTFAEDE
jgi:cobalt-zinc-cadmium efflux system membrane fusion protein